MWRIVQTGGTTLVSLDELHDAFKIGAGFSTRLGGVSAQPFDALNIGLHVGDKPEDVLENRKRLARAIGLDLDTMVFANQVHSATIAEVGTADRGRGARCTDSAIAATDGLMTRARGVALALTFADCVPIILFAPSVPAIAVVHAGWRGTAASIAASSVVLLSTTYGVDRSSIYAVIGPSIGPCCYEVTAEVASEVEAGSGCSRPFGQEKAASTDVAGAHTPCVETARTGTASIDTAGGDTAAGKARVSLDLPAQNIAQLIRAGVPDSNITHVNICTSCRRDLFFSHRADGGRTGRFAAFAYIPCPRL